MTKQDVDAAPPREGYMGENGVLWVSSAVNFPVVCSCLRVALACTPKLERHHAERALRRSRDLLGQEPTSPSLRAPNDMGKSAPKRASDADQDVRPAEAKDGSGPEPPPSGAGGGTDGAPAAPPAPVDSAEELRVLRKRLERLEAQAAQPDGEDPPPGGGGGGGDGGGAGGKATKDRERVRPCAPTLPPPQTPTPTRRRTTCEYNGRQRETCPAVREFPCLVS